MKRFYLIRFGLALGFLILAHFITPHHGNAAHRPEEASLLQGSAKITLRTNETLAEPGGVFSLKNLLDGSAKTAWVTEQKEGRLEVRFANPLFLKAIHLQNGYQKSRRLFLENERVKRLKVEVTLLSQAESLPVEFSIRDEMGTQRLEIGENLPAEARGLPIQGLTLRFGEVYPGLKYKDLCLSGLDFEIAD